MPFGLIGAQEAVLLHQPLVVVAAHEQADGIPQFVEVPVNTAMDDLFFERAVEPLNEAVALRLGDQGIGRCDAPALDLVGERKAYPNPPIIAISGGGQEGYSGYLESAQPFGANYPLAKSFSQDDLLGAVESCLSKTS